MNTTPATTPAPRDHAMWNTLRTELLAFVRRRLRDESAAEDVVQDALAKGAAERERLRDARRLRAWLFQITRNALVDHYRRTRPVEELPDDLSDDLPAEPDASAASVEEELTRCLTPLIERLPEEYREAVVLAELQDMKQRDVAGVLGLSLSGAKSRVQRGRRLLREMLVDCCDISVDARGRVADHDCRHRCGCR